MSGTHTIEEILLQHFSPTRLEVVDESHLHAHHKAMEGKEARSTHFKVLIISEKFAGQSRVDRQRSIHNLLADKFTEGLHALSVRAYTPSEAAMRQA